MSTQPGAKPFLDVTEEDLDGYLTGNLKGTYLTRRPPSGR